MIVAVSGSGLADSERALLKAIQPGGVILLGPNIKGEEQTRNLVLEIKRAVSGRTGRADYPLIYVDQEGGRINRLRLPEAPSAAVLGKSGDTMHARGVAASYGRAAAARGIGVILAPVLDVCGSDNNKVIGDRSFGEDAELVWDLGEAFAAGLAEGKVLPVAKHFPGHGGAVEDSHQHLAHLTASGEALQRTVEPFRRAAESDIPAIMVGHLACPALDPEHPDLPATLSEAMITGLLRQSWGYNGVVITDDMNMQAIKGDVAAACVKALRAGCDAVIMCDGSAGRLRAIHAAIAAEAEKDPGFRAQLVVSWKRLDRFRERLLAAGEPTVTVRSPRASEHVVQQNETLSKIGRLYSVPVDELKRLNGLSGETIRTGDILLIPER